MFSLHSCPRGGSAKKSFIAGGSTPRSNPFPFVSGDRLLFRDRSLSITLGAGKEDFRQGGEGHLIFRRTKGGSVVTVNPKGYH